jgi:hypothetical protein
MKHLQFKTALAVLFVASLPLYLKAAPQSVSGEPLTAKQVRKAEAEAKTAADHLRLAAYYRSDAQHTQVKLNDAEEQMKRYNFWATSTKVPNGYTSSKSLVDSYRARVNKDTELAANHEKMAEALQARASN